jgi:hypothetical protein
VAFNDRTAVDAVGVDVKSAGGMRRCVGQGEAPREGKRLDYSGFGRRWEFVPLSG